MDLKQLRLFLLGLMIIGLAGIVRAQSSGLPCIDQVNLSIEPGCTASISPATMQPGVPSGTQVGIKVGVLPNAALSGGSVVNGYYRGATITVNLKLVPAFVANGKIGPIDVHVFDGTGNSCWGKLLIEDKLPPVISDVDDITVTCLVPTDAVGNPDTSVTGVPTTEGTCSGILSLDYRDQTTNLDCSPQNDIIKVIVRTWYVTNKNGVSASSVQNITVRTLNVDTLTIQPLVEVDCNDLITPAALAEAYQNDSYGFPVLTDTSGAMYKVEPDKAICNVVASYSDSKPIDYCGVGCHGGSKTLRTWIVLDWCTGNVATLTQLIKRIDDEAPEMTIPNPTKPYSVGAWECSVDIVLPKATLTDNCDAEPKVLAIYGPIGVVVQNQGNDQFIALDVPKGVHKFYYTGGDCCGNTVIDSIEITVVDKVAPVATAKEFITVSLTRSGDSTVTGVAKIFPAQIDNGSYDNCTPVYLEIRREAGSPACLNEGVAGYNNNVTYNNTINGLDQTTGLHKEDNINDIDKGQYVKFCCEDIGDTVKVWLRVWDDADGDGIFGSEGDNYNETWAMVKVEDKIVPKIYCENDITTSCDRANVFYNLDGNWHDVAGSEIPAEYIPWVDGVCQNYELEYKDVGAFTICNTTPDGKPIVRTYRVKGFPQVTCTMTITVENVESDPVLEYPIALHNWTKCTLTEQEVLENTIRADVSDGPFYYLNGSIESCAPVGANIQPHDSTTNGYTPVGGFLVEAQQGKSRFNPNYKDVGCNVFGRHITIEDYIVGTGCRKWLVKFDYINWCNNGFAGCRSTVFKFEDTTPPTITSCPSYTVEVDQASCEASQAVAPVGSDEGGCEIYMAWVVKLYNPAGAEVATREGTGNAPKFAAFTGLYPGVYTVAYHLTDGCGNVAECEGTITVIPKDPTPYCISLSSAVMKNGIVELWAKDFDKGSFLNCDPNKTGFILFTFNPTTGAASHPVDSLLTEEHYFKGLGILATADEYNAGDAQRWIPEVEETVWPGGGIKKTLKGGTSGMLFGCTVGDPVRVAFPVEMRVWDSRYFVPGTEEGSDYCKVSLTLENNQGDTACPSGSTGNRIMGSIETMSGEGVSDVETTLEANLPEFPVKSMTNNGSYAFLNLVDGVEYEISAKKDVGYRNGVNTLDLLRIQRHILNITRLDDPHKIIAADANNDLKVDVNDLVDLRKLVLGVIDNLPRNQSWRFVDANQQFVDESNPWPLNEVILARADLINVHNFIAVKVGDVDINASTSANKTQVQTRTGSPVSFLMDDTRLKAGDISSIDVKAENFDEVFGYQFAAKVNGIEILDVVPGKLDIANDMYANLDNGLFTMSYNNLNGLSVNQEEVLFTLKVRAKENIQLSKAIQASTELVDAEAYVGSEFETADAKLEVRGGQAKTMVLYQNVPNPFKAETNINFSVPEASNVRFKVFDVTGKVLMNKNISASKGENMITLRRSDLGANGVLYYQLESGDQVETRKMVIIE